MTSPLSVDLRERGRVCLAGRRVLPQAGERSA